MTGPAGGLVGTVVDHAVLALTGEIDLATRHGLRALLASAMKTGAPRVTVDLTGVGFCDGQGLAELASAAERLRQQGRRLEVRGLTPALYRPFAVLGMTQALHVEAPTGALGLAGALASEAEPSHRRHLVDLALGLVASMAHESVAGADGASVTVPRQGRFTTAASSNEVVLEMDHDQYSTGEGPCLDAAMTGATVLSGHLGDEQRWPAFVPRALSRGIASIVSTPLLSAAGPVGALNVYSRTPGAFTAGEPERLVELAGHGALILQAAGSGQAPANQARIARSLRSRETIALAQGFVMHRDGVPAAAAYSLLRETSRRTGTPLRDVCALLLPTDGDRNGPA